MSTHPPSFPRPSPYGETQPAPLRVGISYPDAETVVVSPAGEADLCTVTDLWLALVEAADAGRPHVIVNLDQLTFLDASTLNALAHFRRRISSAGATMKVKCHSDFRRRLFAVTGLGDMLDSPG